MRERVRHRLRRAAIALASASSTLAVPQAALAHAQPSTPESLWSTWSIDPLLLTGLLLSGCFYLLGAREVWRRAGYGTGVTYRRVASFIGGLLTIAVALISPLAGLSAALFSAHMVQHLILILVAAPLLVGGMPMTAMLWSMPLKVRQRASRSWKRSRIARMVRALAGSALAVLLLHALTIWIWHAPPLYDATLTHGWLHALEHVTFLLTSVLFWRMILPVSGRSAVSLGLGVLLVFFAAMQSSILGVLMLLSRDTWYVAHAPHVAAWGLTPLEDQQLAGTIMWIPAGTIYAMFALVLLGVWLARMERTAARLEHELDD